MCDEIIKLVYLEGIMVNRYGLAKADIRPLANELRLNIDNVMRDVIRICSTKNHNVGYHMFCTRGNVIPEYERDGSLILDRDHIKGLRRILAVDSGIMRDF